MKEWNNTSVKKQNKNKTIYCTWYFIHITTSMWMKSLLSYFVLSDAEGPGIGAECRTETAGRVARYQTAAATYLEGASCFGLPVIFPRVLVFTLPFLIDKPY